jgi:pilus assembly protein FimV
MPAPAPAPAADDGFLSSLMDNPYALFGLGGIIALVGGAVLWRSRQRAGKFGSGETSFIESKIQPDSFFGASGGQRVDTRDGASSSSSSSLNYSLSQLDAIGDVDPVAEADVYLAYGRDLQAEEILKEAQRSDPDRLAIRTKLLEVYAKRADLKTFETQARQLHGLTGGVGDDWTKAQELGRSIDPTNALYQEGAGTPSTLAAAVDSKTPPPSQLPTLPPEDFGAHGATAELPPLEPEAHSADSLSPLELSDFQLDAPSPAPAPAAAGGIDFDFGDLSLDLDAPTAAPAAAEASAHEPSVMPDLDMPAASHEGDPMARKIELADEFRRIGDQEGARELLEEVIARAEGPLRQRAQSMLEELS